MTRDEAKYEAEGVVHEWHQGITTVTKLSDRDFTRLVATVARNLYDASQGLLSL